TFAAGNDESGADDRIVMIASPCLTGSTKLPLNVAPACSRIVSPGFAALSAACTSPPLATLIVFGPTGTGIAVTLATLKPPLSNTSFISCLPAPSVAVNETVVQFCQPPVFGIATSGESTPPNRAWSRPVVIGEET